ncbi:MAG: ATP-dependent Clp protease ATP-binding subunit [Clostridia bacterium]|nr:ATP-dependent Clp protease ATP-binding subunit [Clostridia bacterium]
MINLVLCSVCKKNMAVIFLNKFNSEGKPTGETTGLCVDCAKKQGIDPLSNIMKEMENISPEDMENMSKQLDGMFGGLGLGSMDENSDEDLDSESKPKMGFGFSNLFSNRKQDNEDSNTDEKEEKKDKKKKKKTKYLDTFGENLTEKARNGKLDKVIGRERELSRMIQILNRRSKNNPALIGEPGVGKTAIVNALAQEIVNGNVPGKLVNKEVYMIDMTSLVAGTQFRGQFESRIKGLIDESKSLGNIILAIDEVHNIVGGLEHDNSMNAANMLKPALANGSVQLIGATTLKEYRQYIEKDSALERRFQPVVVDEPSSKDCFEILKGIKGYYEEYHKVTIPDEILKQAVSLSEKYIHDRFLPDKAIDLIDEACARVNLEDTLLAKIEKLQIQLEKITSEEEEIENELEKKDDKNKDVVEIDAYEKAAKIKEEQCKIQSKLDSLIKKQKPKEVSFDNLAQVVELWTKIPVMRVKQTETEKLLHLKENLSKRILGQDLAIESISNSILRKRANIRNIQRPPSFIFVGPTGVGKTALVKELAYELFDNKEAIIKLDMSEYMESHSVSKLIGSPPGYVGYDEAGQLTERVRRNPYSIVLFDEIEKAHPSIFNILLQILDDGKLTDSQGRSVSFKHTIVVLTSNLGTNFKSDGYGFATNAIDRELLDSKTREALKEFFSPEFLNRINDIITFNKLELDTLTQISDLLLKELQDETKEKNILFTYDIDVVKYIVEKGYNEKFGARPLRRAIQKHIEDLLAIEFLKGNLKENTTYHLTKKNDSIIIENI